jgi:hypothetical protein
MSIYGHRIAPNQIAIKDANVLHGLMTNFFHPALVDIMGFVVRHYGVVLTESYREQIHPNDLHGTNPVRAVDLRTWCYPVGLAKEVCDAINQEWIYDPSRPSMKVAIIHDVGQGDHFHIQVHPNTQRRF